MKWAAYHDLAWVEHILATPESYEEEALIYIQACRGKITAPFPSMLHLGCGAGGHDYHFKKHFAVTGVDLSEGILKLARTTNPEVTYVKGDMRTADLGQSFDVVAIPDSIAYMSTLDDLAAAIQNAVRHLKANGVILVTTHIREDFCNHNFVYTGEKNGIHVTLFENNHIVSESTYEAAMIYLIRKGSETSVFHEIHTLGLISHDQWRIIFKNHHLKVEEKNMDHLYDANLMDGGPYRLIVFICTPEPRSTEYGSPELDVFIT